MSPLPLDMPDDYPWLPSSTRYPLSDLGEQAVRLGSPVTYDRRGEVVWYDVGDKGIAPYTISGSGTGNQVIVDTYRPLHGAYNLKLISGSDADRMAIVNKSMSNLAMRRCGLEVALFLATEGEHFKIAILRRSGTLDVQGWLSLGMVSKTLQYYGSDGAYHFIADTGDLYDPYGIYHHLKLVVDFDTGYYVRALFNENSYDLSAYPLYSEALSGIKHYIIQATFGGRLNHNDKAYVGHMIVTGNEP